MLPSITLRDLQDMPEFQACLVTLEAYRTALERLSSWSVIRDEHDERTRNWPVIQDLEKLKTEESMIVLRCQADMQRTFVHFVETLVKVLGDGKEGLT